MLPGVEKRSSEEKLCTSWLCTARPSALAHARTTTRLRREGASTVMFASIARGRGCESDRLPPSSLKGSDHSHSLTHSETVSNYYDLSSQITRFILSCLSGYGQFELRRNIPTIWRHVNIKVHNLLSTLSQDLYCRQDHTHYYENNVISLIYILFPHILHTITSL